MLETCAPRREPRPHHRGVGRQDFHRLDERPVALRKSSRRRERSGLCEEQLDAIVRRARAREQPKGGTEPARCALRRALLCGLAGLTKRRHRVEVSVPRGHSTWSARIAGGAPRAASAWAQRSCAPILHPAGVDSYTTRRTSGWRKRNLRGTSVGRVRSSASNSSSIASSSTSVTSAAAAANSDSNGSPATAAASSPRLAASERSASSSPSAAATADGTSTPPSARSRPPARPPC